MSRNFRELLEAKWNEGKFVCVGLDSEQGKIPEAARKGSARETMLAFNRAIIDATKDLVCAFKLNPAFYEAEGEEGWRALRESIAYILKTVPEVAVILDAKRGDIGNTSEQYARAAFDHLQADAITVNPYQGGAALQPFFDRKDKGIFVWCRASNEGAGEFQDLVIEGRPLYTYVAERVATAWNANENCGVIAGATYPKELGEIRSAVGDMPILVPGVGAQDGVLAETIKNGLDSRKQGLIVNASRSVIFASSGADFAEAARKKTEELHHAIRNVL